MKYLVAALILCLTASSFAASSSHLDEFKIKREDVFSFAQKPVVTFKDNVATIAFETKGFTDCTVAIENPQGRIIRHLASGVLGPKAPEPFKKNAKAQAIVWDGKDDQGSYVLDMKVMTARVSLGLKPRFERTLFWSPKKRIAPGNRPLFASAPEGVYVFEGGGVDHLRLFDHKGNYVRTVYPFPPDRTKPEAQTGPKSLQNALSGVKGLKWIQFPQDQKWLPVWHGVVQATLFTSGSNTGHHGSSKYGFAASAFAVHGNRIALAMNSLNRMATDGTTGGLNLEGPETSFPVTIKGKPDRVVPLSAAFSPDGKTLYMTGYGGTSGLNGVMKLDYYGDKKPELFVGSMKQGANGTDNKNFRLPMSVACDKAGLVYVADYMNDRIQIFKPDGSHHKTIAKVSKPARVFVSPKNGHIYVASWMLVNKFFKSDAKVQPSFTHYGPLDNPKKIASYKLPLVGHHPGIFMNKTRGKQHEVFMDFHTEIPTIWLVPGTGDTASKLSQLRRSYSKAQYHGSKWSATHYQLYHEKKGKLEKIADFAEDVAKAVTRVTPPQAPALDRQRMYVNPVDGMLYIAEGDSGVGKAFGKILQIDPNTGRAKEMRVPFTTEDMAFDLNGLVYLRTDTQVARFELPTWREVPWDYGEERLKPGFDGDGSPLTAVIALPGTGRPGCFHLGGFAVSPQGHIVVSCYNTKKLDIRMPGSFAAKFDVGRPYQPPVYPGRLRWGELHVWDKHGKPLYKDAVGGLPMTDGLEMDKDNNIYVLAAANRVLDGKEYPLERAETLMKFQPKQGKIVSVSKKVPVPIAKDQGPKRPFDIAKGFAGNAWVEGASWLYGGVGYGGFMSSKGGGGCACWNARFSLDLFARSFATELNRFRVAVLDSNGNLILRIGKYGNVDDGVPLIPDGSPAKPRSVGGDEVALCHPSYVASHSDRRLFIADYGNYRILSVKLDYHTTEKISLKNMPEMKPKTE